MMFATISGPTSYERTAASYTVVKMAAVLGCSLSLPNAEAMHGYFHAQAQNHESPFNHHFKISLLMILFQN
jgi:hypothetical protein